MVTAAVILSGGMSRRMGRDKSLLRFGDKTFLQRAADEYLGRFDKVYVSVNTPGRFPLPEGTVELPDLIPGCGPLSGLHAALSAGADAVFLSAVDLPFASGAAAAAMVDLLDGYDACVIRRDGLFEPAFAAYRRSCFPAVQAMLEAGEHKMGLLLNRVSTRWLGREDLPGLDLDRILLNINRPEDFAAIEKLVIS